MTRDGGGTWVPRRRAPVEAMVATPGGVVRVVYTHTGCPGRCTRTLQVSRPGSSRWRSVRLDFAARAGGRATAGIIAEPQGPMYLPLLGDLAAIGSGQAVIGRSRDGGRTWRGLRDPCGGTRRTGWKDAVSVAASTAEFVAVLCDNRDGGAVSVATSSDGGSTWSHRPVRGLGRLTGVIAAASPTDLFLASAETVGSGPYTYRLLRSTDSGRTWTQVVAIRESVPTGDDSIPFGPNQGLVFQSARDGHWLTGTRTLWTTRDG